LYRPQTASVGVDGVEVDTIHKEGDWPILVGGTHYYIQNLLFKRALVHWDDDHDPALQHPILQASDTELHEFLRKVDPEQAARYHPSNRRIVQGRVELYLRTQRPASQIFREQRESADRGTRCSTLVFWVWSGKEALFERLDKRVDKMVAQGVESECRELYEVSHHTDIPIPAGIFAAIGHPLQTSGVLIIGYKEFLPVFQGGDDVDAARHEAITTMKVNTRKYVTDQLKWIRHQFLPQAKQYNVPVYILDASDPTQWTTKVRDPALRVAQAFLSASPLPPPTEIFDGAEEFLNPTRMHSPPEEWRHWECELCGDGGGKLLIVGGEDTWAAHLHSRRHRARKRGLKKRAAFEEWKARQRGEGDTLEL
jgi:tRNA dimethylallyltransferase